MLVLPIIIMMMSESDDRGFMEWLYKQYYRLMLSTAWKYSRDPATVDDIVSDSCLAFMRKINILRELERNKLQSYIVSTVRNTAINYFTKQKRLNSYYVEATDDVMENVADDLDIEKRIVLEDELSQVWSAICSLSEKEQLIMRMKYSMDLPDDVIADMVGLSVNSIRKYISRARVHIKAIIYAG